MSSRTRAFLQRRAECVAALCRFGNAPVQSMVQDAGAAVDLRTSVFDTPAVGSVAAVRALQPAARAARSSVQPSSSTGRQINRRLLARSVRAGEAGQLAAPMCRFGSYGPPPGSTPQPSTALLCRLRSRTPAATSAAALQQLPQAATRAGAPKGKGPVSILKQGRADGRGFGPAHPVGSPGREELGCGLPSPLRYVNASAIER
jgi:hypothetical protein